MDVMVLKEDTDLIVVDKPAGLAAIPDRAGEGDDLHSQLARRYAEKLYIVHRLDRGVSGVMLFAKNRETHRWLCKQFESRVVRKTYLALVHGRPEPPEGRIDLSLRPFGSGRMGVDREKGKPSQTNYRVMETRGPYSLLELQPITGRHHQIRVHLYAIGHPIVGDERYGDVAQQRGYPRLMLHAADIAVPLASGEMLEVSSPVPVLFREGGY